MIMSSIKKRPPPLFGLLGFANFVSAIASALLILIWKVLVTRQSTLDIAAEFLEKIKGLSTETHSLWLLKKTLNNQNHNKNPGTTNATIQKIYPGCCFFAVLIISIKKFLYGRIQAILLLKPHNYTYRYNVTTGGIKGTAHSHK
jgi:hypothetical protein